MDHVITLGDVVHWSLFGLSLASLIGVLFFWLYCFGEGMSDAPVDGPSRTMAIVVHSIPIALLVAWWLT
jgi:hypothetical protein